MGDFNLDTRMSNRPDYLRKEPLKLLNDFALGHNLSQIVEFCSWCLVWRALRDVHGVSCLGDLARHAMHRPMHGPACLSTKTQV